LALASQQSWLIKQLDVHFAFLNEELLEKVFMVQPNGFEIPRKEHQVCRFKKAIYGLCQAQFSNIELFLCNHGLWKSNFDHNLYYNVFNEKFYVILILCVDDVILTRNEIPKLIQI
jgi:hypothetical protein